MGRGKEYKTHSVQGAFVDFMAEAICSQELFNFMGSGVTKLLETLEYDV